MKATASKPHRNIEAPTIQMNNVMLSNLIMPLPVAKRPFARLDEIKLGPDTVCTDAPAIQPIPLQMPDLHSAEFHREFIVAPGAPVQLGTIDASYHGTYELRQWATPQIRFFLHKLNELQYCMYADKKHSLLIVLQGLDASGKDAMVRHLLAGMDPSGCRVACFKKPTPEELDHDFLWRVHPHVPAKGQVAIFNRSHYEDVLIGRVHQLADSSILEGRYEFINEFERQLALDNNTTTLKFLLYISKQEQLARFRRRLEDPRKQGKISEADYEEREYWDDYIEAFEEMLHRTSTPDAPWFVIPSNCTWFRDLAVAQIIVRTMMEFQMQWPKPTVDLADIRRRFHAAELKAKHA
jgi:PPK2 family polyphosphate:nucleotide phosphotransferase